MKKNIMWALCGFCGGLIPSLLFGKYVIVRLIRMKKLYQYMPIISKNVYSHCKEDAAKEKKTSLNMIP